MITKLDGVVTYGDKKSPIDSHDHVKNLKFNIPFFRNAFGPLALQGDD